MKRIRGLVALVVGFMAVPGCGCSEKSGNGEADTAVEEDGPIVWQDAGVDADVRDAAPEASTPDAGEFECGAPLPPQEILPGELYRLPHPEQNLAEGISWNGRLVVYAEKRCPSESGRSYDIYLFGLETLQEILVVARKASQVYPSIVGTAFVYVDNSYWDGNDPNSDQRNELILYELSTSQETRVTNTNRAKDLPVYNGSHVVYMRHEFDNMVIVRSDLMLLEVATGQEMMLASDEEHVAVIRGAWDINEEYVAWRGVPLGEPPNSWDIFYHHIPTGVTSRLHTPTHQLLWPRLSDRWLLWIENRSGSRDIYVHDLQTSLEEDVASGQHDEILAGASGNLVVWFDYRHSGGTFPGSIYDLYVHDMETGVSRRLTQQSGNWGVLKPFCQWFVYAERDTQERFRLYAWDLVIAGVLDQNCHVIPCDPQTEPCATIEWQGP